MSDELCWVWEAGPASDSWVARPGDGVSVDVRVLAANGLRVAEAYVRGPNIIKNGRPWVACRIWPLFGRSPAILALRYAEPWARRVLADAEA